MANPNREVNKLLSNASKKLSNATEALGDVSAALIEAEQKETDPKRKEAIKVCRKEFAAALTAIIPFGSTILALQQD